MLIRGQMFGFKYTMDSFNHNEQNVARSRLFGRVLQVNGPSQLAALYPYLQSRLERLFSSELELGRISDSMIFSHVYGRTMC